MKKIDKIWVAPSIIGEPPMVVGYIQTDPKRWRRAHEIWLHAKELMDISQDASYRVDVITTIKRAVNQRLSELNGIYKFEKMPVHAKSNRLLDHLEFFGIIRPSLLRRLIDIRNAIEHEDESPPDWNRCLEFLDFVWYFLRMTDSLSQKYTTELSFEGADVDSTGLFSVLSFDLSDWSIEASGWCPETDFSLSEVKKWICIESAEVRTRAHARAKRDRRIARAGTRGVSVADAMEIPGNRRDVAVRGRVVGDEAMLNRIFQMYFSMG